MVCSMVLGPCRHQENEKGTIPTLDPIEKGKEAHKNKRTFLNQVVKDQKI